MLQYWYRWKSIIRGSSPGFPSPAAKSPKVSCKSSNSTTLKFCPVLVGEHCTRMSQKNNEIWLGSIVLAYMKAVLLVMFFFLILVPRHNSPENLWKSMNKIIKPRCFEITFVATAVLDPLRIVQVKVACQVEDRCLRHWIWFQDGSGYSLNRSLQWSKFQWLIKTAYAFD